MTRLVSPARPAPLKAGKHISSDPDPEATDDCSTCHGMGYVCAVCERPDGNCTCVDAGPSLVACPECS